MLQQDPNEPRAPLATRESAPLAVMASVPAPEEGVDLQGWLAVLRRRRWLIGITFVVLFSLGMVHTCLQPPVYESTASILVTSTSVLRPEDIGALQDLQAITQNRSVDTQVAVLLSHT